MTEIKTSLPANVSLVQLTEKIASFIVPKPSEPEGADKDGQDSPGATKNRASDAQDTWKKV